MTTPDDVLRRAEELIVQSNLLADRSSNAIRGMRGCLQIILDELASGQADLARAHVADLIGIIKGHEFEPEN